MHVNYICMHSEKLSRAKTSLYATRKEKVYLFFIMICTALVIDAQRLYICFIRGEKKFFSRRDNNPIDIHWIKHQHLYTARIHYLLALWRLSHSYFGIVFPFSAVRFFTLLPTYYANFDTKGVSFQSTWNLFNFSYSSIAIWSRSINIDSDLYVCKFRVE